jgi:hypothetical protein
MNAMHTSVSYLFLVSHPGMLQKPSRACGEDDVVGIQQEESRTLRALKKEQ